MQTTSPSPSEEIPHLARRAARGSLWVALGSYFNIGFGFLANLVLTRLLAPEHFGAFSYASFVFGLLNLRGRVPVSYGFIQKKEITPELIGSHLALNYALSAVGLLLVGLAAPVVHWIGKPWEVAWLAMALASLALIDSFNGNAAALLDRELRFGWTSLVNSIAFPLSYLPGFWLATHGGGPWSLFAQNLAYSLVFLPLVLWISRRKVPHLWQMRWRFDRQVARELLLFGSTVSLGSFASVLVGTFDNFLIGTFVGLETLGYYDRAYRLAQWPTLLVTSVITRTSIYAYARLQDDPARLKKAVTMSFWFMTTLGLPIALGLFITAPDLIRWLYEPRWLPSALYLRFLVVFGVVQPLLGDSSTLFIAIGKPKLSVVISLVEVAVLMIVGTVLTLTLGAVGTCLAVGITFLVGLALTYRALRRVITLDFWQSWGAPAFAAVLTVAGYMIITHLVNMNPWPLAMRVLAKGIYTLVAHFGILTILQPKGTLEQIRTIARLVWAR